MNPQSNESPSLPMPSVGESAAPQNGSVEAPLQQPEIAALGAEQGGGIMQPPSSLPPVAPMPVPVQSSQPVTQTDVPVTSSSVVPGVTDDADLIEKEWVEKAKAIVDRNRDDPFKQSEALTVVKSDYLRSRYNKTLKPSK